MSPDVDTPGIGVDISPGPAGGEADPAAMPRSIPPEPAEGPPGPSVRWDRGAEATLQAQRVPGRTSIV
jgi:hypothetical protein